MEQFIHFIPRFFEPQELFDTFEGMSSFTRDIVTLYGKDIPAPRTSLAFGSGSYSYAGMTRDSLPWFPALLDLKNKVEAECGEVFNYALVNKYQDGSEYIGWHSDKEGDLVTGSSIVSLSLGTERDFQVREKQSTTPPGASLRGSSTPITTFKLKSGDCIIMRAGTQSRYNHCVPKRARVNGVRYNITFRNVKQ